MSHQAEPTGILTCNQSQTAVAHSNTVNSKMCPPARHTSNVSAMTANSVPIKRGPTKKNNRAGQKAATVAEQAANGEARSQNTSLPVTPIPNNSDWKEKAHPAINHMGDTDTNSIQEWLLEVEQEDGVELNNQSEPKDHNGTQDVISPKGLEPVQLQKRMSESDIDNEPYMPGLNSFALLAGGKVPLSKKVKNRLMKNPKDRMMKADSTEDSVTLIQIKKTDRAVDGPVTRLYQILITKMVHMIWKIHCQQRIQWGDKDLTCWHTQDEARNLWIEAINRGLMIDCLLANRKKYGSRAMAKAKVLSIWK
ncbi:hypothetical protein EDD85DRAFT_783285 [Armillaria nabsnona]|nr:hypothetical protein EDD85DRAFT_783285 [Armillaria nabsnona]